MRKLTKAQIENARKDVRSAGVAAMATIIERDVLLSLKKIAPVVFK